MKSVIETIRDERPIAKFEPRVQRGDVLLKGDKAGHSFYGNQHKNDSRKPETNHGAPALREAARRASDQAQRATEEATIAGRTRGVQHEATKVAHGAARAAHEHAAQAHGQLRNDATAGYHRQAAAYHGKNA